MAPSLVLPLLELLLQLLEEELLELLLELVPELFGELHQICQISVITGDDTDDPLSRHTATR